MRTLKQINDEGSASITDVGAESGCARDEIENMLRTDSQDCGLGLETTGTTRKDKLEGSTVNYADWPWEITLPQAERLQRLCGKKKIPLAGDAKKETVPEPDGPSLVEVDGFEPTAFCLQSRHSTN